MSLVATTVLALQTGWIQPANKGFLLVQREAESCRLPRLERTARSDVVAKIGRGFWGEELLVGSSLHDSSHFSAGVPFT